MPKSLRFPFVVGGKVNAPNGAQPGTEWIRLSRSSTQPSSTISIANYRQAVKEFGRESLQARAALGLYREAAFTKKAWMDLWFGFRLDEAGSWRWTGFLIQTSDELNARRLKALPMIGTTADLARSLLDIGKPVQVMGSRRRGRIGHTQEFWEQIAELHAQAMKVEPRTHVRWLRANLPAKHKDVSEDTLRRWVRLIREGKKP